MTAEQPKEKQEVEFPFSKEVRFESSEQWVLVDNNIGIGFSKVRTISIICDKRIHIKRDDISDSSDKIETRAEIGHLKLTFSRDAKIFIGNDSPFMIQRTSPGHLPPVIRIQSTKPISIEHTDLDMHQMKQGLEECLRY